MKIMNAIENKKGFDFIAFKLFFSIIAILLSVILTNAKTAKSMADQLALVPPLSLEKIILDFNEHNNQNFLRTEIKNRTCEIRSPSGNSDREQSCQSPKPKPAPSES